MTDIRTHLDKIRSDAAECLVLSSLAPDGKREVFTRIAEHLNGLASDLEKTIATIGTNGPGPGVANHEPAVAPVMLPTHSEQAAAPRRALPWLLVIVLGAISGALVWANSPAEKYWPSLLSKHEPAPGDDTGQAIATLLSGEQGERKILREQLVALVARVDMIDRELNDLKNSRADIAGSSNTPSASQEDKSPNVETKPPTPEQQPPRTEEDGGTSKLEASVPAKKTDLPPPAASDPPSEPADRVGAISPRRAELDARKPVIGPPGCTQFRSFDPVSGTYTTLDGRRRQCR
jgi:hypothetical protein